MHDSQGWRCFMLAVPLRTNVIESVLRPIGSPLYIPKTSTLSRSPLHPTFKPRGKSFAECGGGSLLHLPGSLGTLRGSNMGAQGLGVQGLDSHNSDMPGEVRR